METVKLHTRILSTLNNAGHQAFIVGGYVRDKLLGRESKDIDITTSATPEQVLALFPGAELIGAHFGVVLVKEGDEAIEVATFRVDGEYADSRHPSSVAFTTDVKRDLARRDFTMNTLLIDGKGRVLDFFHGQMDLNTRSVRAVGIPHCRFEEDALRMLRAVRFASQLGFTIEDYTYSAIRRNAHLIKNISAERIAQELNRILTSGDAARGVYRLWDTGLLGHFLPEVATLAKVRQNPKHHPEGDVFNHTLGLLAQLPKGCSLTLALAALLHDVGKAPTFALKDGQPTFYDHESVGKGMARVILNRLKYPNEVIDVVCNHVGDHMRFRVASEMRRSKLYRFLSQPNFAELLELHKMDARAGSGNLEHAEFVERVLAEVPPEQIRPQKLVTGNDLIDLGIKPGPRLGQILNGIDELQLEGAIRSREEALLFAKTSWEVGYVVTGR